MAQSDKPAPLEEFSATWVRGYGAKPLSLGKLLLRLIAIELASMSDCL